MAWVGPVGKSKFQNRKKLKHDVKRRGLLALCTYAGKRSVPFLECPFLHARCDLALLRQTPLYNTTCTIVTHHECVSRYYTQSSISYNLHQACYIWAMNDQVPRVSGCGTLVSFEFCLRPSPENWSSCLRFLLVFGGCQGRLEFGAVVWVGAKSWTNDGRVTVARALLHCFFGC